MQIFSAVNLTFAPNQEPSMPDQENPQTVAVVGAGTFGTAIANLLAHNVQVLL